MAVIVDCTCIKCRKRWRGATGSGMPAPTLCGECEKEEKDIERREYFGALDGLTLEERVRKIEEWIYNYKKPNQWPQKY